MTAIETEVKFRVREIGSLQADLERSGFRLLTERTFEQNTLYDTGDRALRLRGEILRVRRYGSQWVVTHKCLPRDYNPSERYKQRIETETRVEDGEAVAAIFKHLGFGPVFTYEKWRTEWADSTGHCVVDETPIGLFAELEGPADWIDRTARALGLGVDELITLSYGKLFDQWKLETGSQANDLTFEAILSAAPAPR